MGVAFTCMRVKDGDTTERIRAHIIRRQTALTSLLCIIFTVAWVSLFYSLVNGYSVVLVTGGIGRTTAVPHTVFLSMAFFTALVGILVTRFDVTLNMEHIDKGFIWLYVMGALNAIVFTVEIVFSSIELYNCVTVLCTGNQGILVAEIVGEAVLIVLSIWLIIWTWLMSSDWKVAMRSPAALTATLFAFSANGPDRRVKASIQGDIPSGPVASGGRGKSLLKNIKL